VSIFGAVKERTYELIETGEYVFTLNELEYSAEGMYGEALIWKWLMAPQSDPTDYIAKANGDPKTLFQYTDVELTLGSKQHEWASALMGKRLEKGDTPPEQDEIEGRRMVAYLTHYTVKKGKNAGQQKEQIVPGSAKVFKGPQPNSVKYAVAEPKQASPSAADRDAIVKRVEKLIGKAVMLETPNHLNYVAEDIAAADTVYLNGLAAEIEDEIKAAVLAA